jgi:FkbM family methyltransferase
MKNIIRRFIDRRVRPLARSWRWTRDNVKFMTAKRCQTSFGFTLYGDASLDEERLASNEAREFIGCLSAIDLVLDVGSHVGYFALLAAAHGKPVIAIEPNPLNLRLLLRNLSANDAKGIEVFPVALSSEVGVKPLFGGGQGASLKDGWGRANANYRTLVPVNTLSNLLGARLRGKRLLIKIDAEGSEKEIVSGGKVLLEMRPQPIWIIEHAFPDSLNEELNSAFKEFFELFWANDYDAYSIWGEKRLVTPEEIDRWLDAGQQAFGWMYYMFRERQAERSI